MIADEAERLANLLPTTAIKKLNERNNIFKDLFVDFRIKDLIFIYSFIYFSRLQ